MASFIYNGGKKRLLNAEIDLDDDSLKVALVTSSYSADKDNHDFFDDISNEVSGTGYTAGGKALANGAVSQDNTNDRAVFDGDDVTWTLATLTARAAILYKDTGTATTSPRIAYVDFEDDKSADGDDFTIEWHEDGILYLGE